MVRRSSSLGRGHQWVSCQPQRPAVPFGLDVNPKLYPRAFACWELEIAQPALKRVRAHQGGLPPGASPWAQL